MMTFIAFIVAIGILVTVHEFGHYIAARSCGVHVLRFSIGFGKPIFSYQRSPQSTEWVLALLPLGGYVKMLDRREASASSEPAHQQAYAGMRAFDQQAIWAKMWIVLAGPLANLLLAFVCYWGLIAQGEVGIKPMIGAVEPGSLSAQAKLRAGDMLVSLNGEPVQTWQDAQWALLDHWMEKRAVVIVTQTVKGERHTHRMSLLAVKDAPDANVLQSLGLSMQMPTTRPVIGEVVAASVAEKSGLQSGDLIVSVNQKPITDWQQFVKLVRANPARPMWIDYQRGQQVYQVKLVPESMIEGGQRIGRLGAAAKLSALDLSAYRVVRHYTLMQAAGRALHKMQETILFTLKMIAKMLTGQASLKAISGPVSIADAAGETAGLGLKPFISFVALLSISIAVMNLLPIPVLDGGHLLYHMAEFIRGKPLSDKVLEISQRVGLGILGALMVIAFMNDINRYLIG